MAITQVKTQTALGLYFLGAAVKSKTILFTRRNTYRLKKEFVLFSTKSYSVGLLDFYDFVIKDTNRIYTKIINFNTVL